MKSMRVDCYGSSQQSKMRRERGNSKQAASNWEPTNRSRVQKKNNFIKNNFNSNEIVNFFLC